MNNVMVSTQHGMMLVNRQEAGFYFGVGLPAENLAGCWFAGPPRPSEP